jgi:hypothetical protein
VTQAYSDPSREHDTHALPDIEVFQVHATITTEDGDGMQTSGPGWYWWPCFPGCLPDGEPNGPFATEAEALADAQQQ